MNFRRLYGNYIITCCRGRCAPSTIAADEHPQAARRFAPHNQRMHLAAPVHDPFGLIPGLAGDPQRLCSKSERLSMFDKDLFDKDMVCHYTGKNQAISILNDKQINFSSLLSCDDPRESKQWNFDFIGSEQRFCLENYREVPIIFDNFIKKNSMVLCFCEWNDEEMNFEKNMVAVFRQPYYRAGFAKSRMWSQYGKRHTGVCLVFDKNQLEKEFKSSFEKKKRFVGRVEYQYYLESFVRARKIKCRNIIDHSVDEALQMQIDEYYHEYFFLKSMDYRDEHEYRLVLIVDDGDSAGLPIESSLRAVIVGVDFPPENYESIDALAQNCNSSVERWFLSWQEGRPQLFNLWELLNRKRST